jgi:hypothetical protein
LPPSVEPIPGGVAGPDRHGCGAVVHGEGGSTFEATHVRGQRATATHGQQVGSQRTNSAGDRTLEGVDRSGQVAAALDQLAGDVGHDAVVGAQMLLKLRKDLEPVQRPRGDHQLGVQLMEMPAEPVLKRLQMAR